MPQRGVCGGVPQRGVCLLTYKGGVQPRGCWLGPMALGCQEQQCLDHPGLVLMVAGFKEGRREGDSR